MTVRGEVRRDHTTTADGDLSGASHQAAMVGGLHRIMSGILDELGLNPEDFDWQQLSLCSNTPTMWFYESYENDEETAKAVDELCLHCPVFAECFKSGADGEWGVWAGIYWNGAGKPDAKKNEHKSEETWDRIKKRVVNG
jgi:hypothetical protein